jgi:hypothetical protein
MKLKIAADTATKYLKERKANNVILREGIVCD